WRAMASAALPVAIEMPRPAMVPGMTARAAAIATVIKISSNNKNCVVGSVLFQGFPDENCGEKDKHNGLNDAVKDVEVQAEGHRHHCRHHHLHQLHDDEGGQHIAEQPHAQG